MSNNIESTKDGLVEKSTGRKIESPLDSISTVRLTEVETSESIDAQLSPAETVAIPPLHGHGWPQETVPYPISRAMEFCLENCQIARHKEEPIDSENSHQRKCRFPQHCSIVFRVDKC